MIVIAFMTHSAGYIQVIRFGVLMSEIGEFPADFAVASCAVITQLALMYIILLMTVAALLAETFLPISVALLACNVAMLVHQLKF